MTKSAAVFIEESGGEKGAAPTSAAQFGCVVNIDHPAFSPDYVEKCARGVLEREYDSIAPSAGTDTFYVTRIGEAVIATTRFRDGRLKKYKLIA